MLGLRGLRHNVLQTLPTAKGVSTAMPSCHRSQCAVQEAGLLPDNFLGNHRTWLGFAKDTADGAQSGYNTASAKAKAGYHKAKATVKDNAPEF